MVNKIKKIIGFVLIFGNFNVFSQKVCPPYMSCETIVINEDFNNDRKIDKLVYTSSFEPDIAYMSWEIHNGENGQIYAISIYSVSNMIKSYAILQKNMGYDFLSIITKTSQYMYLKQSDASLKWLISYAYSKPRECYEYFTIRKINVPTTLHDPRELKPYFIVMRGDSLRHLQTQEKSCWEGDYYTKIGSSIKNGILFYNGSNYFDFINQHLIKKYIFLDKKKGLNYEIYQTPHGIYTKRGNYYTWLYVSDYCLTSSSLRQRHPSIINLKIVNGYLFVQTLSHIRTGYNIIIDLETKSIVQLNKGTVAKFLKKDKINIVKYLDEELFATMKEINIEDLSLIFCL